MPSRDAVGDSSTTGTPRRVPLSTVDPSAKNAESIYRRADGRLEVGYRDEAGRQRWKTIEGGISAARAFRDEMRSRKRRGEVTSESRVLMDDAAAKWLAGPVASLRDSTQRIYADNVRLHIGPSLGGLRLDRIDADRMAMFVRDLKAKGLSENSSVGVLGAVNRIYRYAARSLNYRGVNPVSLLLPAERPQAKNERRRRLFSTEEFRGTIVAARGIDQTERYTAPWAPLFLTAAYTAARVSEILALVWEDLDIDSDDPTISFSFQLDRSGKVRVPLKTDGSERVIPVTDDLAAELRALRDRSTHTRALDYVFCSRTGTALSQRNTDRALRAAMRAAVDVKGVRLFPILGEPLRDAQGRIVYEAPKRTKRRRPDGTPVAKGKPKMAPVPRGSVPSMHSFRHTFASRALAGGESVDELAFLLGHADGTVTRQVYIQDVQDARRRSARRDRIASIYGEPDSQVSS